ncbi:MAG: hypothetical protein AAFQ61_13430, partial [Cyanobacteria bacterium J06626_23]
CRALLQSGHSVAAHAGTEQQPPALAGSALPSKAANGLTLAGAQRQMGSTIATTQQPEKNARKP